MDTLGTKIIVLISEVSLFQGENSYVFYMKLGLHLMACFNQVSLRGPDSTVHLKG